MTQPPVRPPTRDRKRKTGATKAVGLARLRTEVAPTGEGLVTCSCGATKYHVREKVREDWIDAHINRRHNGRGIRL